MMNSNRNNYINFSLEEIERIKTLNAKYRKVLKDAKDGTGLCSTLPENVREAVAKTFKKRISDNEEYIREMLNSL